MDQGHGINPVDYAANAMILASATYEVENGRRECGCSFLTMLTGRNTYMPRKHIVARPVRSVAPSGLRSTKIRGQLRQLLRSVGRQIGAKELLELVHDVIRQDLQH